MTESILPRPSLVRPPPKPAYAVFAGVIDQLAVGRFFGAMSGATQQGYTELHLLFQTIGGTVGDGICLYNFFKSFPLPLTAYNSGSVQSAGVISYLGASVRKTSASANFMIHRTTAPTIQATAERLTSIAGSVVADDERMEAILKARIKLTDDQWAVHRVADLWLSAEEAKTAGITEIGDFTPPKGIQIFNI